MVKLLYKIFENPYIYNFFQKTLGSEKVIEAITSNFSILLEKKSYKNVLDVGCGTGFFLKYFNDIYYGIDINEEYISKAKKKGRGNFFVGDATSIMFDDNKFDVVFTIGVLHHLKNDERNKMLREMYRVCKKNGFIIIGDGLIPSNKSNLIGYLLAKLDRGRYKMKFEIFKNMINNVYQGKSVYFKVIKIFPYEIVIAHLIK